jgi:hypothetical protein
MAYVCCYKSVKIMWEYKVITNIGRYKEVYQEEEMNKLGKEGWELVSIWTHSFLGITIEITHTFKRKRAE